MVCSLSQPGLNPARSFLGRLLSALGAALLGTQHAVMVHGKLVESLGRALLRLLDMILLREAFALSRCSCVLALRASHGRDKRGDKAQDDDGAHGRSPTLSLQPSVAEYSLPGNARAR